MKIYLLFFLVYVTLLSQAVSAEDSQYSNAVLAYSDSLNPTELTASKRAALQSLANTDTNIGLKAIRSPEIYQDSKAMALALNYPARDVQIIAAQRLEQIGTKSEIPKILAALKTLDDEVPVGGAAYVNGKKSLYKSLLLDLVHILNYPLVTDSIDASTAAKITKMAQDSVK